jgi:arylsulfatase A-like enzyme
MKRRDFLKAAGVTAASCLAAPARTRAAKRASKPNFLWILSEDNSKHYLKLFDPMGTSAPNIEKMAERGIVFDRAFSNAPVCSVARTTIMSGAYAPRVGSQYHRRIQMAELPGGLRLFPAYLKQAGYYTTNNRKKDYNVIEGKGVWDESSAKSTWRKRSSKTAPFFHMESTGVSHEGRLHFKKDAAPPKTSPKSVTLAPYHPDTPLFRRTYAHYHDCMKAVDAHVAKLVGQLEEDGLLEDTFIFYFGDHGGVLPGSKGYIHESGLHVPLVVRVPENWKHLAPLQAGSRTDGFVSFIDFGPTVLNLADVDVPKQVDGKAFLGKGVTVENLAARDETFGYADRFDEKYDLCRSFRKGKYKYLRNYQAYLPDGLQNNYRYIQLAYREWRQLYKAGKLNAAQRQFYEGKAVEGLYDIETDPHEIRNLAGDPKHAATLADLRARLQAIVKGMPDLSFYPESEMIDRALPDGAKFGQARKADIARLVDAADLSLLPFSEAKPKLTKALASSDPWERYWALTACSCFGKDAKAMVPAATARLKDDTPLVRVRAAEFLAIVGAADPRPTLVDVLNRAETEAEALIAMNTVVYINDHLTDYPFDVSQLKMKMTKGQVARRLDYLRGKA